MDLKDKVARIKSQANCPVFTVKNGHVSSMNMVALQHNININQPIDEMIYTGLADYKRYTRGTLYITVKLNNIIYNATVVRCGVNDVFILDSDFIAPHHKQIHRLTGMMREPMSEAMMCLEKLCEDPMVKQNRFLLQMKQNIYKVHRSLCNMSAQPDYTEARNQLPQNQNLTELVEDLVIKSQMFLRRAGYKIKYSIPRRHIICSLDWESYQHALLNMMTNAMKNSRCAKSIYVRMVKHENYCDVSVTNYFEDPSEIDKFDLCSIFSHDPLSNNYADGAGLGLNVMRSAAMLHNGSLLMHCPNPNTMRLTLSIPVEMHAQNRKPRRLHTYRPVSYTGGYNELLTEYSELLPPESFK